MAIPIDKEMRARAKKDDKVLMQLTLDTRSLSPEMKKKFKGKLFMGVFQISGPTTPKAARELWLWYLRWTKRDQGGR
jgi:hypothetical protein